MINAIARVLVCRADVLVVVSAAASAAAAAPTVFSNLLGKFSPTTSFVSQSLMSSFLFLVIIISLRCRINVSLPQSPKGFASVRDISSWVYSSEATCRGSWLMSKSLMSKIVKSPLEGHLVHNQWQRRALRDRLIAHSCHLLKPPLSILALTPLAQTKWSIDAHPYEQLVYKLNSIVQFSTGTESNLFTLSNNCWINNNRWKLQHQREPW